MHHAVTPVTVGVGIGDAHEDGEAAAARRRAARPPLVRVDDVVVAIARDPAGDVGGVGARHPWLGHGEARARLAVEQRSQELLRLERCRELDQRLHVAGVGRRAVRGLLRQRRLAHQLAQGRVLEVAEPGPVVALGEEQVPQAAGPRLRLQVLHHRRMEVRVTRGGNLLGVDDLRRVDPLGDEVREPARAAPPSGHWGRSPWLGTLLRALGRAAGRAARRVSTRTSRSCRRGSAAARGPRGRSGPLWARRAPAASSWCADRA